MRDIDPVAVDETGTLNLGHPSLSDCVTEGIGQGEARALVAGVEPLWGPCATIGASACHPSSRLPYSQQHSPPSPRFASRIA